MGGEKLFLPPIKVTVYQRAVCSKNEKLAPIYFPAATKHATKKLRALPQKTYSVLEEITNV